MDGADCVKQFGADSGLDEKRLSASFKRSTRLDVA
jgi:hypothetical protein